MKILDINGVSTLWRRIKETFARKDETVKSISRDDTTFTVTRADGTTFEFTQKDTTYGVATESADGLMSSGDKAKLNDVESGAQENVIESVSVNGADVQIVGKGVDIIVPTALSSLVDDVGYLTEESDPTVPSWAKQPQKPTYTASEVGALPADTHIPTDVSELNNDAGYLTEHQDISGIEDAIAGLTIKLNTLADSDDTTLDQLSEIVAYIKNNKSLIDGITTGKVSVDDIVDSLTSTATNKPLSAKQGKVLKDMIDGIVVPTKVSQLTNDTGYLTQHQDISGKANTADLATVATSGSYTDLSNKPTIPTVPTKVSDLTDDSGHYTKPSGGIPASDMASSVQTSLGKANSAYQKPSSGIPASDMANGVIPAVDNTLTVIGAAADAKKTGDELSSLKEDFTSLESRVDAIEEAGGLRIHRYGVSGVGQAAVALTRIWDSVGMTAQVGTDGNNSNVVNNFDDVTPFNRRKCVGDFHAEDGRAVFTVRAYLGDDDYAEDGSMGKFVAVECPRAYYYMKNGILGVSAHQYPGWKPFDIFCHKHDPNETIPFYYMPAYALAIDENGEAVSLPGYDNAQGDYKSLLDNARTYKGGELGTLAMLMPAAMNFYEWALYTVEFATQNCQNIMQGCAGLRQSNDDHCTFVDATHVLTNNYYAARVVGEYIAIVATNIDCNHSQYLATHKILSVTRCDENGNASASGTHQLVEIEDLGKDYYTYDTTGATEYRFTPRPYRTGSCNVVSTPSGSPVSNADSYHPCKYRWHENPFSNQYKTTVDLFNERVGTAGDNYYLKWYLLDDPTSFESKNIGTADLETDAFVELDIETAHENYANGYIKSKKYSDMYNGIWIPYETSGGSYNTYFCDYAYLVISTLVRSVRFGGSWSSGSSDGFSYAFAFSAPSNAIAHFGGDLCLAQ